MFYFLFFKILRAASYIFKVSGLQKSDTTSRERPHVYADDPDIKHARIPLSELTMGPSRAAAEQEFSEKDLDAITRWHAQHSLSEVVDGCIDSYDEVSAWGRVSTTDGSRTGIRFHATSFWSRRQGAPMKGQKVEMVFRSGRLFEVRRPFPVNAVK